MFWSPILCPQVSMVQSLLVSRQQASVSSQTPRVNHSWVPLWGHWQACLPCCPVLSCVICMGMRHPDNAFNLGTLILWWSHIFVSVLNGYHSIPHIPLPSANFLFCNLTPLPVMSGACSLQGEPWYFYSQSSAFPHISTVQSLSAGLDTVGLPSSQTSFSFTAKNWDDFPPTSLAPTMPLFSFPFNCGYFPNRVFYIYSLSIYHLLWVRNQFYKFQWNAHQ